MASNFQIDPNYSSLALKYPTIARNEIIFCCRRFGLLGPLILNCTSNTLPCNQIVPIKHNYTIKLGLMQLLAPQTVFLIFYSSIASSISFRFLGLILPENIYHSHMATRLVPSHRRNLRDENASFAELAQKQKTFSFSVALLFPVRPRTCLHSAPASEICRRYDTNMIFRTFSSRIAGLFGLWRLEVVSMSEGRGERLCSLFCVCIATILPFIAVIIFLDAFLT